MDECRAVRLLTPFVSRLAAFNSVIKRGRSFVLLKGIAAVDDNQLARDVGGGFGSKKGDRRSDLVRAARAADRSISARDCLLRPCIIASPSMHAQLWQAFGKERQFDPNLPPLAIIS